MDVASGGVAVCKKGAVVDCEAGSIALKTGGVNLSDCVVLSGASFVAGATVERIGG